MIHRHLQRFPKIYHFDVFTCDKKSGDMSGPVPIVFRPVLQLTINTVEALQIREKKGVPVRRLQVFLWCKFFSPSSIHSNSNRTGVTI